MSSLNSAEVEKTSFEFICPFCFDPWYEDIESKSDVCVNQNCSIFDKSLEIKPPYVSKQLEDEAESHHSEITSKLLKFEGQFLSSYLYESRRSIISDVHERKQGFNIPRFFALNELLRELNLHTPNGKSTDDSEAEDLMKLTVEYSEQLNMLDDLMTLRFYLGPGGKKVYGIKYWSAFNQMLENYGIIDQSKADPAALFKYLDVDAKAIKELNTAKPIDLISYFKNTYLQSIRLRLLFGLHRRTHLLFEYEAVLIDLAALSALFFSIGEATDRWPVSRLQSLFERNVPAGNPRRFSDFEAQFIDSKETAPVIVRCGDHCYVDRHTILFFLHYLVSHDVTTPEGKKIQIISEKKNETAIYFEDWLRGQLIVKKYAVTETPVEVDKHQYDVIAVKEEVKRILLIEAKYKDFFPSAITGKTLLEQELYDEKEGLLTEAIRQLNRHEFFVHHPEKFTSIVKLTEPAKEYAVLSFVVTKYQPLISKYRTIKICSSEEFLAKHV